MQSKILKISLIILASVLLLIGGIGFWVYRNQDEFFVRLKELVNDKIEGSLEIKDFKFTPFQDGVGFTFSLMGVKLKDSKFNEHHTYLIDAGVINVTLETEALFRRKVLIRSLKLADGKINIFKRKDGFTNLSVFSTQNKKTNPSGSGSSRSNILETINQISFDNFQVQYVDSLKEKSYGVDFHEFTNTISQSNTVWDVDLKGDVLFKGIIFNAPKGGFLTNQETELRLALSYNENTKKLTVKPSELEIASGDIIKISGNVGLAPEDRQLSLNFEVKDLQMNTALTLLTQHLQKVIGRIGINPTVTADVHLNGSLEQKTPKVDINFKASSFQYQLPIGTLKDLNTKGIFTNQADSTKDIGDENSRITAKNITGFFETLPLKGNFEVNNLANTLAVIDCVLEVDPASLNAFLDPTRYQMKNGKAIVNIDYKGGLVTFFDEKANKLNGVLRGSVSLQDIGMAYLPQKVTINKIKGDITFNEKEINMPALQLSDGQNNLFVNGKITGLFPYLFVENSPLKALVNIKIPNWNLNWLGVLLNLNHNRPPKPKNGKFKLSALIDKAIATIEIEANLEANRFKYNRLSGEKLRGKMTMNSERIKLHNFSMNAFGGTLQIAGTMSELGTTRPIQVDMNAQLVNTDIKSVFSSFNNFGQYAITDRNIKGRLGSNIQFSAQLNNDASLVTKSINGKLSLDLNEAEVIDFEPFLKMKRLIFRKRQLEHVQFAPITNDFIIKGTEIEVKKMQIESNVLTLFLDGIYSFADKTDLTIQIPLSNLRKRDSTYQFKEYNPDTIGSNIFLKAIDENGKVNIKYFPKKKRKRFSTLLMQR